MKEAGALHGRGVTLALTLLLACSCAPKRADGPPFSRIRPVPPGKAVVYVYRFDVFKQFLITLKVNGVRQPHLSLRAYEPLTLDPGRYEFKLAVANVLGAELSYFRPISIEMQEGHEYFIEVDEFGDVHGVFSRSPDEALVKLPLTRQVRAKASSGQEQSHPSGQ